MKSLRGRPRLVAVFGGAFDPPHLGHALLPSYLLARGLADLVVVAPCADHPFGKAMRPFGERLALTQAAMEPLGPAVMVTDLERRLAEAQGGPSVTLRLLEAVAAEHPDAAVRLVVGSDIVSETGRWHRWDAIEARFDPIVVPRAGYADPDAVALPAVSSTAVRDAVVQWNAGDAAAGERLEGMVPAAVLDQLRPSVGGEAGPVWLVGRGHVAHHAAPWLRSRGSRVLQVGARDVLAGRAAWPEVASPPGAVWILVRDGSITSVADHLAGEAGLPPQTPILHGAGALLARDALAPAAERGHPVATLHPICSLRTEHPNAPWLGQASFGLEGDPAARAVALRWLGAQPHLDLAGLDAQGRRAYHGACALAANHLAVMRQDAARVLRAQGHAPPVVDDALDVLLASALDNLVALGVPGGITGPVSRGNQAAVQAHVEALPEPASSVYAMLSARLTEILAEAGPGVSADVDARQGTPAPEGADE